MCESCEPVRVVLVDDTVDLRDLLRLVLERAGYEVVGEAGDGQAALGVVQEQQPDLVLLDLSMPVMDGMTALPLIREIVPHACIVVFSGFGSSDLAQQARDAGADAYLQKGLSVKQIVERIGQFIDQSSLGA